MEIPIQTRRCISPKMPGNAWEIIDISDIKLYESEIFEYIDLIEIEKFEEYKKCFKDNISEVKRLNEDDAYYEKFVNQVRLYPQTADYIYDKLTELEKRIAMILKS